MLDHDAKLFVDSNAEESFNERFSTLNLLIEREVSLEDLSQTTVPRLFMERHWQSLVMNLITPVDQLVREFYSNIHNISESRHFSIFIRGKIRRITPDLLSNTFSFPRNANLVFPYNVESCPPLDTLTSFLA